MDCQPLMDACSSRLYMDNAFRVTELPIDASTRNIKRRLDELKIAAEVDDLTDEFTHAFAPKPLPSIDAIRTAGQRLQDPQKRLVDEFFWFWPLTWDDVRNDAALVALASGDTYTAYGIWSAIKNQDCSDTAVVAKHNLAVLFHLIAIDWEHTNLSGGPPLLAQQMKEVDSYWKYSFKWWEELAESEPFWSLITQRVRSIDDPRLTTGFVRRMRSIFPVAFDNVNAGLAAALAKAGKHDRAALHINYMRETHAGLDDTSETLRAFTEPLHERIDHSVRQATDGLNAAAKEGATRAMALLESTSEPLRTLTTLLSETDPEARDTADEIADACHTCLIAYGIDTNDWPKCVGLLKTVKSSAASKELKSRIQKSIDTAVNNEEQRKTYGACWFCKKAAPEEGSKAEYAMHGQVQRTPSFTNTRVTWQKMTVTVPRCEACKQAHENCKNGGCLIPIICAAIGSVAFPIGTIIGGIIGLIIAAIKKTATLPAGILAESAVNDYPPIKELRAKGWDFGEKPSGIN